MIRKKDERPKVAIPVYRLPSSEVDWDGFFNEPEKLNDKDRGTKKFYSSLRYPSAEVVITLWYN